MLSCEGGTGIGELEMSSRDFLLHSFSSGDAAGFFLLPLGVIVLAGSSAVTPASEANLFVEDQIFSFWLRRDVVCVRDT